MDTKISDLDAITTLTGTEEFVVADSGETHKISANDLVTGLEALGLGGEIDWVHELFGTPTTAFEFDSSSLTGLTAFGTGPDVEDADTTVPGHYYIREDHSSGWVGRYMSVTPPCTLITKITDRVVREIDGRKYGLVIGDSTFGTAHMDANLVGNGSNQHWVELAQTANIGSFERFVGSPVYLAIRANSSTDVDYLISHTGAQWTKAVDSRNPGLGTLSRGGIAICPGGTQQAAAFDYLRYWSSALTMPGAVA